MNRAEMRDALHDADLLITCACADAATVYDQNIIDALQRLRAVLVELESRLTDNEVDHWNKR